MKIYGTYGGRVYGDGKPSGFECCSKCGTLLREKSETAFLVWIELCSEYFSDMKPIRFRVCKSEVVEMLEGMRFITTHETDTSILVRVEGHNIASYKGKETSFFCLDFQKHIVPQEVSSG